MTSDHRYIISIIDQTTFLEKLWTKLEKKHFGRALVLIRSKMERKKLFCRALVRKVVKIEKKTPVVAWLW